MAKTHHQLDDREMWIFEEPKAVVTIYYPGLQSNWIGTVSRQVENWCDEGLDVRTYAEAKKLAEEWCKEIETKHKDDWPNKDKRLEVLQEELGIYENNL